MRGAANRCARIGACRKSEVAGRTMCPSFMATRDEQHSTRGRANALVHALSSPDPHAALGDRRAARHPRPLPRVQGVQDRVSAVGGHGGAQVGVPVALPRSSMACRCASRMFGHVRTLNRVGSALAPLSNWVAGAKPMRALAERFGGIDRRRALAAISSERRYSAGSRRARATSANGGAASWAGRLPGRFVHELHGAGDRPRGDRAARDGRMGRAARGRRLLRPRADLERPARRGPCAARRPDRAAGARGAARACRSSAASRRASSRSRTSCPISRAATRGRGDRASGADGR